MFDEAVGASTTSHGKHGRSLPIDRESVDEASKCRKHVDGEFSYEREECEIVEVEVDPGTCSDFISGSQLINHGRRGPISQRDRRTESSYGETKPHHKHRRRSKEFAKDAYISAEEGEGGAAVEEDERRYLVRIEEQLAKQEDEDAEKIKEESRKRRQAVLEKYKRQQEQIQQHSEPLTTSHDKDDPESIRDHSDLTAVNPSFIVAASPTRNRYADQESTLCDDIFGESPVVRNSGKGDDVRIIHTSTLDDNWDDPDAYYCYRVGEVFLDGRFEIKSFHGKGVYSTVVRAKDLQARSEKQEEVAIKILRSNHIMYKAGLEEMIILKKLAGADPEDKRHCGRYLFSFKHRNHLCLIFESLHMNLRQLIKQCGRDIGLNLTALKVYAKQLFIALKHLQNCGVLHCDIKPDNMLVDETKNVLKLCDFGNAMFAGKNEMTPLLVSRFYRAPEIILGLPYGHPLDMWSVGCCLHEIFTGKILFPGASNHDMLRLHIELKGPFPKKMLRKGAFAGQHFDPDSNLYATEERDPVMNMSVERKRLLLNVKQKEIGARISSFPGENPNMLSRFKDLLERIFILDPEKRMTAAQALSHPFITDNKKALIEEATIVWLVKVVILDIPDALIFFSRQRLGKQSF